MSADEDERSNCQCQSKCIQYIPAPSEFTIMFMPCLIVCASVRPEELCEKCKRFECMPFSVHHGMIKDLHPEGQIVQYERDMFVLPSRLATFYLGFYKMIPCQAKR